MNKSINSSANDWAPSADPEWDGCVKWLTENGFLHGERSLTARGRSCAALSDGQPLVLGTVVSDGWARGFDAAAILSLVALFLDDLRSSEEWTVPAVLRDVVHEATELCDMLGQRTNPWLCALVYDWCVHRDLARLCARLDAGNVGNFVRAVLRVASHAQSLRQVLIGLGHFEEHAALDGFEETLFSAVVSNNSLYFQ